MIARRYPAALGGLAGALVLLAVSTATQAAQQTERANNWFAEQTEPIEQNQFGEVAAIWALAESLQRLPSWAVLGAAVAGVAALVLLVLRARAQAGSASATAFRVDVTASSRS